MSGQTITTTAIFEAEERGVAQTAAALNKLEGAAKGASGATSQFTKTTETSAAKIGNIEREVDRLQKQLAGAPNAWREYERSMAAASRGFEAGKLDAQEYSKAIQQIQQQLQRVVAPRLSMDVNSSGLATLLGTTEKVSAASREAARDLLKQAEAQKVVEAEAARSQAMLAQSAAKLKAELDPVGAAYARMKQEIDGYHQMAAQALITQDELSAATARSRQAFDDTASSLKPMNDNLQLAGHQIGNLRSQVIDAGTMIASGSSFTQVLATQSGQIYEAIAGQKGISHGLQELKGTAVSGFSAVVQFLGPGGLIVAGATAAASAVVLFGTKAEDRMERVAKSAEGFRVTLADIRKSNADLADMIERVSDAASRLSPKDAQNKLAADIQAQRRAIEEARQGAAQAALSTGGWSPLYGVKELFGAVSGNTTQLALAQITDGFLRGSESAETLRSKMLALKASVDTPSYLRASIDQILAFADAAIKAEGDIRGFENGLARLRAEAAKLRFDDASNALKGLLPDVSEVETIERTYRSVLGRIEQLRGSDKQLDRDGMREIARRQRDEALAELSRPARESLKAVQDSLNNLDLSPVQRQIAETTQEYDRRIAEYKRTTNDAAGLAALQAEKEAALQVVLKETTRAEEARQANYKLELASVTDITAAQRANTAAQRAYNDAIAAGYDKSYASERAAEASTLSLAQARQQLAEASRQTTEATQRQIEQAQLEYDLVGKSAGEVARLRAEFDLLAQAKDAARSAGFDEAQVKLTDEMRRQAAEIGRLADETARLNLSRDQEEQMRQLQAEAGLIGMNDDARRVALAGLEAEAELRRQGIPLNDAWGQSYVANARQIATMEGALDKQQSAFEDLRDAAKGFFETLSSGGGIMDALASTFGKFAQQLASKGFDQLFGGLFGKGQSNAPTIVGAITQAATQIPAYGSGMGVDQTYAAPLGAVTRAPLPPVVTGEGFSSSKASTVARQSVPAQMWNFFASKGLASHQIAGILGNARAESAFNPNARGDGGAALGLFQWNDRANAMKAFVGPNWQSNVQGQLEFAWKELQTSESKAYRALLQATNVTQATEAFLGFERPHGYNTGVRNSHNYSGRVGYAQEAFSQFEGRSPTPVVEARTLRKGVAEGVVDANQKLVGDNWGGLRTVSPGAPPAAAQSGGLFGARGQAGFSVLGAGLGAFSNGYQSGSPLSGGLGGAFSGYGAGGAISSFLGIGAGAGAALGVVGGAALGIIGGILGAHKQRQEAHKQAAAQWEQVRPQYEAFDASLSGDRGDFRTYITDAWNQLSGFMDVGGKAWKMGKGNSTAQFDSTGRKLFEGFLKMLSEFQEGFDSMVSDMASGQGLQGAFAKGRAATKDLASQLKKTRDDIDIAFGNIASIDFLNTPAAQQQAQETERQRADAIARYNAAAGKYALSLLYTAEKVSDVQQTIDGLRGTAAGLVPIFKDLGWNADEAARAIDERLNQAIANIARGLEQDLADRIDELNGKGYFTSVRSFLEEYEGLQRDFSAAGADASRLPEFFKLQAQSIVDGAEITGDAFAELVRLFPQLNGVVVEAGKALGASTAEIADAIRGYEDRLADVRSAGNELVAFERRAAKERTDAAKFGADALASLEKTLAAERAAIVLSQAKAALEQSYQAETDRINDLLNARRDEANELESTISKLEDFRDQVKEFRDSLKLDDNLSTLNAQDRVTEAGRQFRELLAKARGGDEDARGRLTGAAQEYLNEAKGYYQTSTDYGDIFEEVNRALADTQATTESALSVSQSQLDALKRQITLDEQQLETNRKQYEAILGLNEGIKSLEVAFREYAAAAAAARAAGIVVAGGGGGGGGSTSDGADYDRPRVPGVNVSTESAKYLANNADVAAAIKAGQTFGLPAGLAPEAYAAAHFGLHGQGEGRKWATGGLITGPGTGTSDSIPMWASNGEFMMREAAVSSVGVGTMDYINRTGRLPTIAMPASPRMVGSGNDNRGIEQRLDAMQRTLIALTTTTGGGLQRVAEAGEAGARATEQRALAERRSANNKQAA